ncbi:MAG: hypothetical protein JWM52_293 [Candidatus Saccharibacteria bacterium]|nr:hypothetical protein [Candidatus Saccharibacteria bacterium]
MPVKRNTRKNKKVTIASHIKSSLVYVAPHKHTGHRLAHRHTSHGFLFLFLALGGILLFLSLATLNVSGLSKDGSLNVTAVVLGDPPTVGAVITTPQDKTSFKNSLITVSGTCPYGTIVSIYNNGDATSSTSCSSQNVFSTTVQLRLGVNTLQAQDYDDLDQAGPITDQINVSYHPDTTSSITPATLPPATVNQPSDITIDTTIPETSALQPSESPCYQLSPDVPTSSVLGMSVNCVTRNVFVGERVDIPISLWGGIGPYALSVDWGDANKPELFSISEKGRHILSHTYLISQAKSISLHVADSTGQSYQIQTVIQVNTDGTTSSLTGENENTPFQAIVNSANSTWIEASVPIYWAAVSLFLGFWVGDIFQRLMKPLKT